jgi:oxygen-independent coproporphyrinogen-3 oxidase
MPKLIKSQCLINAKDLPSTNSKIKLITMSIHKLLDAGYIHIGMDHFALPDDSLSVSLSTHRLHRNFQGYSTHGDCDLIGFGVSAISHVGDCYSQNTKILSPYKDVIAVGEPAFFRGYNLSRDDVIRVDVIQQLMCKRTLDLNNFSLVHAINAQLYFSRKIDALKIMTAESLLTIENKIITITDDGCLFLRNIAMIFDKYLQLDLKNNGQDKLTQPLNTSSLTNLHGSKSISFSKVL